MTLVVCNGKFRILQSNKFVYVALYFRNVFEISRLFHISVISTGLFVSTCKFKHSLQSHILKQKHLTLCLPGFG